jgi:uncharacterized protein (TIGR00299 family) protein
MRIAFFDPFSGASGDMILGALIDAGLSVNDLRSELGKLNLANYTLTAAPASQHGIHGTSVTVTAHEDGVSRDWATIRDLLLASALAPPVRDRALAIFQRLAEAEAQVHGSTVDHIHFHEVGGVDAIVDIAGASIGLALLGIERIYSGPPRLGQGFVWSQHGQIPVPAPATAELLARAGAPVAGANPGREPVEAELLTPTGAAILTTIAEFRRPDFVPTAIGYGFGSKELPWPNALRVWIGESDDAPGDGDLLLETNIDDMNPQFFAPLVDELFAAGALDVWLTPITMKKGRPAIQVSVIVAPERRQAVENALIANSTTLGVRATAIDRVKASRRFETVATRWGDVRLKLRGWQGRVLNAAPEYDDCLALAQAAEVPIQEVWNEAHRIGEMFVGQRWPDHG